jgi:alpha-galactosidase
MKAICRSGGISVIIKRTVLHLIIFFFGFGVLSCYGQRGRNTFPFGDGNELVYDTQTGMTKVLVRGKEVISNAYAVVSNAGARINSTTYTNRSIAVADLNDAFGIGKKVTVTLTADGLPDLQQIFYAYSNRNYFLTEVVMSGTAVSSNYMAPLVSDRVMITNTEDHHVICVPFDNDTFIRYNSKSLKDNPFVVSSEVTACYNDHNRSGLVAGSVEHTTWKTGVKMSRLDNMSSTLAVWGGYSDANITRDAINHGAIAGNSVKSPKIFVGLFEDWREGLEEYGKANTMAEPRYVFNWNKGTPFGWNSWGVIQTGLTLEKAKAVVNFFTQSLPGFRNDSTAYIDLDSYWDNMVQGGLGGNFAKLTEFANYCKANGLRPGIYWAPFVDWGKQDRPVEGSTFRYAEAWTKVKGGYHDLDGGRAMDPTHPATLQRIKYVINKFKSCGFEMIKIDFIGHATIESDHFYDVSVKTGMQAFRKGMEYLIDVLESKMLIYAAISPSLATGRYAHMRRIACDAFSDISATEYTLNSTTYGWWQTYIYDYVDGDHVVFKEQSLGENRARLTSAIVNGRIITGDDFSRPGQWTTRAIELLQQAEVLDIARDGIAFRPVEGNSEKGACEMFEKQIGDNYYLAIFNYGTEKSFAVDLGRLSVNRSPSEVKELYTGKICAIQDSSIRISVRTKDAAILKFSTAIK